jgi:hypothetical protein
MAVSELATACAERGRSRDGASLHAPWKAGAGLGVGEGGSVFVGTGVSTTGVVVMVAEGKDGTVFALRHEL